MIIKAEGIIFRSFNYSETSLIVDVFTKDFGILSFIISGVRKKKSKVSAAMLQVMNIVDIVAFSKNTNSLGRITEIKNNYIHKDLLYDFVKSSIGIFIIELSRNCIKEKESNKDIYNFIKEFLIYIDNAEDKLELLPLIYLINFSKYLGFVPNNNYNESRIMFDWKEGSFVTSNKQNPYCMDESTSKYFHHLLATSDDINKIQLIPKTERQSILETLLYYYQYHIESFKPLKSYKILEEMMND